MANRYTREAKKQVGGVYDQQIQAAQSQIPAIQNLYKALTEGLQSQTQQQIQTGTRNIVEDASSRGVLRSTLPVDAGQELQSTLGQALAEALGQYGAQQASDLAGVRENIGSLRVNRATAVQDLAGTLQDRDFRQKELEAQERMNQMQLEQARLNASGGGGGSLSEWQYNAQILGGQQQYLNSVRGSDGYVSPNSWKKARDAAMQDGIDAETFDAQFYSLINPAHFARKDLKDYAVSSSIEKALRQRFDKDELNFR